MTDFIETEGKRHLLRPARFWFPTFTATALMCISLLLIWSATDASFRNAVWKAKVSLRLQSIPCADPEAAEALGILDAMRAIKWDSIGKRAMGLWLLFGVGIIATVSMACIAVRKHTVIRIVVFAYVLVAWGLLYGTHIAVDNWRAKRQINAQFGRFEEVGLALHRNWPTESGELPHGIRFFVLPDRYPDVLSLRGPSEKYPFHEDFGRMITRGQSGIIRFDLAAAYDSCVEFHPNGTLPTSYTSGFGNPSPPVASVIPLKKNWFLVRYGRS